MQSFAEGLSVTPLSQFIQVQTWIIPWLQIIHIVSLALVFASVFMVIAKVLRLNAANVGVTAIAERFLPWIWGGTIVLAITGTLLVIGEPVRSLINTFFWTKMGLLAIALIVVAAFQWSLSNRADVWEGPDAPKALLKLVAVVSLIVWSAIIICGRFIAYADNFAVY